MKVAVIGLGLFGRSLAVALAREGVEVIAVDRDPAAVDDVKDEVALAVCMDSTEERELRAQGIDEVDALVACIGQDFESNQLVVIMAKKLGIRRVISRTSTATHARILSLIGADEVVQPEVEAAEEVARRLRQPSLRTFFQVIEGFSVVELEAPKDFVGKTLADINLRKHFRVNLIAIKKPQMEGEKPVINPVPMGSDTIAVKDILVLAGDDYDLRALGAAEA
jgi:trk system potassium uptake protein